MSEPCVIVLPCSFKILHVWPNRCDIPFIRIFTNFQIFSTAIQIVPSMSYCHKQLESLEQFFVLHQFSFLFLFLSAAIKNYKLAMLFLSLSLSVSGFCYFVSTMLFCVFSFPLLAGWSTVVLQIAPSSFTGFILRQRRLSVFEISGKRSEGKIRGLCTALPWIFLLCQ